jgi:hypothetical protein
MHVCLLASMQVAKKKKEPKSFSASDSQNGVNLDGACLLTCKLHKFVCKIYSMPKKDPIPTEAIFSPGLKMSFEIP